MAIITSYETFIEALTDLTVTGITRTFTEPPNSIGSADLPAMWPGLPSGEEIPMTFQTAGGWPTLTCDLIVAVEAVAQDTQSANFSATVEIMDNLSSALRLASIGRAALTWTITANAQVQVAGVTYWAVIATVSGK